MTNKQFYRHGFTLVELLIAITIGILVVSAATAFIQRTVSESKKISDSAMLQQTAFFVSHMLNQHIRQAGYKGIDTSLIKGRLLPIAKNKDLFPLVDGVWLEGQFLKAEADSISFRFNGSSDSDGLADGSIVDCSGNSVAAGTIEQISFMHVDNKIICMGNTVQETIVGSDERLTISELVINLGIDETNDGSIERYVDAAVATDSDFAATREVVIRLLMVSTQALDAMGRQYQFNHALIDYPDNHYRREVVVRSALRNL
ncbi:MAG: prepilin-type N-terminal cleavage/methylation domain-containing protein [Granulosicoccus sp.]